MRIVKLQCIPYIVAEALHELRPFLVALVRASIDNPAPNLVTILLKLPLDVVCIVESCLAIRRTSGRVLQSLGTIPDISFPVKVVHG